MNDENKGPSWRNPEIMPAPEGFEPRKMSRREMLEWTTAAAVGTAVVGGTIYHHATKSGPPVTYIYDLNMDVGKGHFDMPIAGSDENVKSNYFSKDQQACYGELKQLLDDSQLPAKHQKVFDFLKQTTKSFSNNAEAADFLYNIISKAACHTLSKHCSASDEQKKQILGALIAGAPFDPATIRVITHPKQKTFDEAKTLATLAQDGWTNDMLSPHMPDHQLIKPSLDIAQSIESAISKRHAFEMSQRYSGKQ